MSNAEVSTNVPTSWETLLNIGRRSGTSAAFMEQLEGLSATTERTLYRDFVGTQPPCLPGVAQTPPYIRGVFRETVPDLQFDEETLRQKVAMRLGVWSLFLESGGHLDVIVAPQALTWRPEGVDDESMYKTLQRTLSQAHHPQVTMRILQDGPFAARPRDGFGITYMHGFDGGRGEGDISPAGSTSTLLVRGNSVDALERSWADVEAAALGVAESRSLLEAAVRDFHKPGTTP